MTLSEIASEIKAGRTCPALIRELLDIAEKQQVELSAIDEALGEFYCPVVDGDGERAGSFFKDHGVHLAVRQVEELQRQNAHLQAQIMATQTSVVADTVEQLMAENSRLTATNRRLMDELGRWQDSDGHFDELTR